MQKKTKIIISLLVIVVGVIAFLSVCYWMYKKDAKLSNSYTVKGEQLLYAHKTSEAINELEKALKLNPGNTHAESVLLDIYLNNKQYKKAIEMQLTQLKLSPDEIWDFKREKRLGEIYVEKGDIGNAKKIYESLVSKYTKTPGGYLGLAICYERENNFFKAIEYQKKAVYILQHEYKIISKPTLKKELQKLAELYGKSGQEDLSNKTKQGISGI